MRIGVLFIHGFTGGPYEVQPFITYVKAHTDWKVEVPTLPGHGVTLNLKNLSAESWMMEAELAFKRLQKRVDRVIIVGFSMGGLIAMYLARRYEIDRLVLLSAAAKYISPRFWLDDVRIMIMESITKTRSPNTFYHMFEYKMTRTPFRATLQFLKVVRMVDCHYDKITIPVCIVQGNRDGIVPPSAADYLFEKIGSEEKQIIRSTRGHHHICYSDDCEDWFAEVLAFMKRSQVKN